MKILFLSFMFLLGCRLAPDQDQCHSSRELTCPLGTQKECKEETKSCSACQCKSLAQDPFMPIQDKRTKDGANGPNSPSSEKPNPRVAPDSM